MLKVSGEETAPKWTCALLPGFSGVVGMILVYTLSFTFICWDDRDLHKRCLIVATDVHKHQSKIV